MYTSARRGLARIDSDIQVTNFTFNLYMLYIISFFLHIPARIPAAAFIRMDMLIAISLIIMLVSQQEKLVGRIDNHCNRYLTIFLVYVIISLPLVEWPGSVLRGNLVDFIKAILFFYFTVFIVDSDVRLKRFVFIFMSCQIIRVLEPLYLHETSGYWGSKTYLGMGEFANRLGGAPSDIINPNGLGFVIATLFPFLHYLWGNSRWHYKLSYLALIGPLLYALVLTMSRSGLVALLVILGNIFIKSRHKLILIMFFASIVMIAWSNLNDIQRDRYLSLTGSDDTIGAATVDGRLHGITKEFNIAAQKPIVGYGLGTSKEAINNVIGGSNVSHNLYLETFMETGIIGLIIFIFFIHSVYQTLRQTTRNFPAPETIVIKGKNKQALLDSNQHLMYERNLLYAIQACFWMYIVFSLAQYGLREYHWYLLAGITTALNRLTRKHQQPRTDV